MINLKYNGVDIEEETKEEWNAENAEEEFSFENNEVIDTLEAFSVKTPDNLLESRAGIPSNFWGGFRFFYADSDQKKASIKPRILCLDFLRIFGFRLKILKNQ